MMSSGHLKIAVIGIIFLIATVFYWQAALPTNKSDQPVAGSDTSRQKHASEERPSKSESTVSADAKLVNKNENKESENDAKALHVEADAELALALDAINELHPIDVEAPTKQTATPPQPEQYETEETDAHWAFDKESYYINLFSEEESLSGFVLSEAQCKTQQCRLSFLLDNEEQKDEITNRLMEKLMNQSEDIRVSFDLNSRSDEAVLFIEDN